MPSRFGGWRPRKPIQKSLLSVESDWVIISHHVFAKSDEMVLLMELLLETVLPRNNLEQQKDFQ